MNIISRCEARTRSLPSHTLSDKNEWTFAGFFFFLFHQNRFGGVRYQILKMKIPSRVNKDHPRVAPWVFISNYSNLNVISFLHSKFYIGKASSFYFAACRFQNFCLNQRRWKIFWEMGSNKTKVSVMDVGKIYIFFSRGVMQASFFYGRGGGKTM